MNFIDSTLEALKTALDLETLNKLRISFNGYASAPFTAQTEHESFGIHPAVSVIELTTKDEAQFLAVLNRIQGLNSLRHVQPSLHPSWTWVEEKIEGLPVESSVVRMAAPLYRLALTAQPPGKVMPTSWKRFSGATHMPDWFFTQDKIRSQDPRELIPALDWLRHVARHSPPARAKALQFDRASASSHVGYVQIEVVTQEQAQAVALAYGEIGTLPACDCIVQKSKNGFTVKVHFNSTRMQATAS